MHTHRSAVSNATERSCRKLLIERGEPTRSGSICARRSNCDTSFTCSRLTRSSWMTLLWRSRCHLFQWRTLLLRNGSGKPPYVKPNKSSRNEENSVLSNVYSIAIEWLLSPKGWYSLSSFLPFGLPILLHLLRPAPLGVDFYAVEVQILQLQQT